MIPIRPRARLIAFVVPLMGPLLSSGPAAGNGPAEVREGFDAKDFDRTRWVINPREPVGLKADLDGDAIHLVIPPGSTSRAPAVFRSRFGLDGDFDIRARFLIKQLPRPDKEWVNVEIVVEGRGGTAAVIRTNHSKLGPGYALWFDPGPGVAEKGAWAQVPSQATAGTLRLQRTGPTLRYWVEDRASPPRKLGEVIYGMMPVDSVGFRVSAPALRYSTDVMFDDIAVDADRIFLPTPPPVPLIQRTTTWVVAAAVLATLGGLWYWIFGSPARVPEAGRATAASRPGRPR